MKLKEFRDKYMSDDSRWDFKKFSIVCNKCKSKKIEFNGFLESEGGYYGDHSLEGAIIVKCHGCGEAFRINAEYELELNKDGEKEVKKCMICKEESNEWGFNGICSDCRIDIRKVKKRQDVKEGVQE